jgi:hypothetical protein
MMAIICSNHVFQGYSEPIFRQDTGFGGTDHSTVSLSSRFLPVLFFFPFFEIEKFLLQKLGTLGNRDIEHWF